MDEAKRYLKRIPELHELGEKIEYMYPELAEVIAKLLKGKSAPIEIGPEHTHIRTCVATGTMTPLKVEPLNSARFLSRCPQGNIALFIMMEQAPHKVTVVDQQWQPVYLFERIES